MIPMQLTPRLCALSQRDTDVHQKLSELTKHLGGIVRRNNEMALGAKYNIPWRIFVAFNKSG
jgi:hypothetical protein